MVPPGRLTELLRVAFFPSLPVRAGAAAADRLGGPRRRRPALPAHVHALAARPGHAVLRLCRRPAGHGRARGASIRSCRDVRSSSALPSMRAPRRHAFAQVTTVELQSEGSDHALRRLARCRRVRHVTCCAPLRLRGDWARLQCGWVTLRLEDAYLGDVVRLPIRQLQALTLSGVLQVRRCGTVATRLVRWWWRFARVRAMCARCAVARAGLPAAAREQPDVHAAALGPGRAPGGRAEWSRCVWRGVALWGVHQLRARRVRSRAARCPLVAGSERHSRYWQLGPDDRLLELQCFDRDLVRFALSATRDARAPGVAAATGVNALALRDCLEAWPEVLEVLQVRARVELGACTACGCSPALARTGLCGSLRRRQLLLRSPLAPRDAVSPSARSRAVAFASGGAVRTSERRWCSPGRVRVAAMHAGPTAACGRLLVCWLAAQPVPLLLRVPLPLRSPPTHHVRGRGGRAPPRCGCGPTSSSHALFRSRASKQTWHLHRPPQPHGH